MYLSAKERQKVLKLIETLGQTLDSSKMRERAGFALLDLLQSDQFASFVWNEHNQCFDRGVLINISPQNVDNYQKYYYQKDPITEKLAKKRAATLVNQIMPQQQLIKTEFYNDFLAIDGLHYGVNLHAHQGEKNVGDIRVWRSKRRANFDEKSAYILDLIKPYFCNAMSNIAEYEAIKNSHLIHASSCPAVTIEGLKNQYSLTKREAQITLEILEGYKDEQIASKLYIAFSTLRTHIKHIFYKLEVNSRQLLIKKILENSHC
ncbi:helix-turn-helix transcriptional regulator [Shewanella waksmanii]|uniref:helix-turn-helix transcriptional regulator n=1 Tax=Shewanella waksmanii TaxID=213783 RepID=UPI003735AD68